MSVVMLGARQLDLTSIFAPEGITEAGLGAVGFERAGPTEKAIGSANDFVYGASASTLYALMTGRPSQLSLQPATRGASHSRSCPTKARVPYIQENGAILAANTDALSKWGQ